MRKPQRKATLGKRDWKKSGGPPQTVEEAIRRADALDRRRQEQIANQVSVINGLQDQLREAKTEIFGLKVAVWCILWEHTRMLAQANEMPEPQHSAEMTIPRKEIQMATAGRIKATTDADGNMVVRIEKE